MDVDLKALQKKYNLDLKNLIAKSFDLFKIACAKKIINSHDILAFFLNDYFKFISEISYKEELGADDGIELARNMCLDFTTFMMEKKVEGTIWESFSEVLNEKIDSGKFVILFENYQIDFKKVSVLVEKSYCC